MCPLDPALLAPPYKRFRVSPELADAYMHLFVNRPEYSIQAAQPMMNGKVGWYLARDRNTREPNDSTMPLSVLTWTASTPSISIQSIRGHSARSGLRSMRTMTAA